MKRTTEESGNAAKKLIAGRRPAVIDNPKDIELKSFDVRAEPHIPKFDKKIEFVSKSLVDERSALLALHAKVFRISKEEAEKDYERSARRHFKAAAKSAYALGEGPLCLPEGAPPRFTGSASTVYQFLLNTYPHRTGGKPLTLKFLREHDPAALTAFRSRRRSAEVPEALQILTAEGKDSSMETHLADHDVDLSTPDGKAAAVKLASTIMYLVYNRK